MAQKAAVTSTVVYRDAKAALAWLETAFGFEVALLLEDAEGNVAHAEMTFRDCGIGVCGEWEADLLGGQKARSPLTTGGQMTQFLRIELESGLDEHCAHARAAGARICQEPADQFYGARTYRALDPDGHVWSFSQDLPTSVSVAEQEALTGLKYVKGAEAEG